MEHSLGTSAIGATLLTDSTVTVHTKPYEIKTVKVKFALPPSDETAISVH